MCGINGRIKETALNPNSHKLPFDGGRTGPSIIISTSIELVKIYYIKVHTYSLIFSFMASSFLHKWSLQPGFFAWKWHILNNKIEIIWYLLRTPFIYFFFDPKKNKNKHGTRIIILTFQFKLHWPCSVQSAKCFLFLSLSKQPMYWPMLNLNLNFIKILFYPFQILLNFGCWPNLIISQIKWKKHGNGFFYCKV